jgi:uncharacterized coiled-coil DUF342 family protein
MEDTNQKGGMDFLFGNPKDSIDIDRFIAVLQDKLKNELIDKETGQIKKDGKKRLEIYHDAINNYENLINTDNNNINENYQKFNNLRIMRFIKFILDRKQHYKKLYEECNTKLEELSNEYEDVRTDFNVIVQNTQHFSEFLKTFNP